MRRLLAVVAFLCVPLVAGAEQLNIPLVHTEASGIRVTDTTFTHIEGDSLSLRVSIYSPAFSDTATALVDSTALYTVINPTRYPAWLNFQFAADAATKTAWFNFYCLDRHSINATSGTYSWSGWIPVFLNGAATPGSFQVGLWDSCIVRVVGSSAAKVEFAWTSEVLGD